MNRKLVIVVLALLAVVLAIAAVHFTDGSPAGESMTLSLYSEGPVPLAQVISGIENSSYYEGYDNDTLNWMKSLGDMSVFSANGSFVIMDSYEASKIPSQYVTDVIIIEHIRCDVLENRPLGNVKNPKDVMLVKNVEYLGEEIIDLGLA